MIAVTRLQEFMLNTDMLRDFLRRRNTQVNTPVPVC